MYLDFIKVKNEYLTAAERTYVSGIQTGTGGNLSARLPESNRMLVKPSGFTYGSLSEENLIVVDFEGNLIEGNYKPTRESVLHGNIYKKYPSIGGIVHTHSPYSIMCSLSFDKIENITMHTKLKLKDSIPIVDVTTMVVTEDEMGKIYTVMDKNPEIKAIILEGHGIVAFGKDAIDAEQTAELIEETAKIYWELNKHKINKDGGEL